MTELENHLEKIKSRITATFDCEEAKLIGRVRWNLVAVSHRDMRRYVLERHWVVDKYRTSEWHLYKLLPGPLTPSTIAEIKLGLEHALGEIISPSFHQMETHLIGILLTNQLPAEELQQEIRKFRRRRSFLFGLKGWAILELALVSLSEKQVVTPKSLRSLRKVLLPD